MLNNNKTQINHLIASYKDSHPTFGEIYVRYHLKNKSIEFNYTARSCIKGPEKTSYTMHFNSDGIKSFYNNKRTLDILNGKATETAMGVWLEDIAAEIFYKFVKKSKINSISLELNKSGIKYLKKAHVSDIMYLN